MIAILGVQRRLSWAVCKLFFSKITKPFPQKSHESALKLTELWNTSLVFDLNYKFLNRSLSFHFYIYFVINQKYNNSIQKYIKDNIQYCNTKLLTRSNVVKAREPI